MEITTLSQHAYDTKKAEAINNQFLRKELTLSEFDVVDNSHINIDGVKIEISKHAFKRLLARFRVPAAFAKRFQEGYGDDGLKMLLNTVKNMKSAKNDQAVTLIVNPQSRIIVDILPKNYASITPQAFFDYIETHMDRYNLEVKRMGANPYGGQVVNCIAPNMSFGVPGLDNEWFTAGVSFSNSPTRGMEVSPYVDRVICQNGMTSKLFAENYQLHLLSDKNMEEFNKRMVDMAATGFKPVGFAEKIQTANEIDASLAEIEHAANLIMASAPAVEMGYIQRYVPINRAMKAYEMVGAKPEEFTAAQKKNAKSGIKMWDLVNGLTNFASNDSRYNITDWNKGRLLGSAGDLLFKKTFDTEALLDIDPFAGGSQLLDESELQRLRGEA